MFFVFVSKSSVNFTPTCINASSLKIARVTGMLGIFGKKSFLYLPLLAMMQVFITQCILLFLGNGRFVVKIRKYCKQLHLKGIERHIKARFRFKILLVPFADKCQ